MIKKPVSEFGKIELGKPRFADIRIRFGRFYSRLDELEEGRNGHGVLYKSFFDDVAIMVGRRMAVRKTGKQ